MKTLMRSVAALIATGVLLGLSAQALGDQAREPSARTVNYADLDLSKPAGAAALYRRIDQAARIVCETRQHAEVRHQIKSKKCYEQAVASAVKYVNRPQLTALYDSEIARKTIKRGRRA